MADDLAERIGRRVHDLRRGLDVTQDALAEDVDVDVTTISRLERGKTIPSVRDLSKIAVALKVDLVDLFVDDLTDLDEQIEKDYEEILNVLDGRRQVVLRRLLRSVEERYGRPGWRHRWR